MFVIVDKEKEETDRLFGTDSIILSKGIDFTHKPFVPKRAEIPLHFVYTGSLIIGRAETIAVLSDVINEINSESSATLAGMDVYSQDTPILPLLNRMNGGACSFRGSIGREEVLKVQREADVVVFAESLAGKSGNIARLSFSTKITDYLSNGKCVLAIGREDIAPIDYFRRNDSALIACTRAEIKDTVRHLVSNPDIVESYSRKAYDCAIMNHSKDIIDNRFMTAMKRIAE